MGDTGKRAQDDLGAATADFEAMARQYWQAWGDALRQAAGGVPPQAPGWQDAVEWWGRLARGGNADADAAIGRFDAQARDWYAAMQQLAAHFAGQEAGAAEIASEWKRQFAVLGDNAFPDLFKAMRGHGAQAVEQWREAAGPWLEAMRREGAGWLGMPAFGLGREHQERWQALLKAQLECQRCEADYNALMFGALQRAHEWFADKLAQHEAPGRQLKSARALFDLWIDAAEEAYAEAALSHAFRHAYGAMVNAQMRLRQGVQGEVERAGALFGMPTRTEIDSAHRRIAELERELRRMRTAGEPVPATKATRKTGKPAAKPARKPAAKAGGRSAAAPAATGKAGGKRKR